MNTFKELLRISKNQIIWGANHFIDRVTLPSPCWLVWYKKQNPNDNAADCELAYTSFKTAVRMLSLQWSGFGHINIGETRIHPTQKPVKLYEWLLTNYAKKDKDFRYTFRQWSQSSAIAAHYLELTLSGQFELDKDYFEAAKARFDMATKQLAMSI